MTTAPTRNRSRAARESGDPHVVTAEAMERAAWRKPALWTRVQARARICSSIALFCLTTSCGKATRLEAHTDGTPHASVSGGAGAGGASDATSASAEGTGGASSSGGAGAGSSGMGADAGVAGTQQEWSLDLDSEAIYTRVQRLTNSQWEHAVTDILRLETPPNLAKSFQQPVIGTTDFTNNEQVLLVGEREVVDYEAAAEAAAALATGSDEALTALYPGTDPEGFVTSLGRRAFRRPLSADEQAKYQEVFEVGEDLYGPGFANGAALVIRAMLQSPHFLYRTELGPAGEPLNGYELAAKLSLWLLDTSPSDALLDDAALGVLDSTQGVESTARAMLDTPNVVEVMRDFHGQLYSLRRLVDVYKPDVAEFGPQTPHELATVSYAFFDSIFERDEGLREILTSTRGYAGPELAQLYGVDVAGAGIHELDLGPARMGYFMQAPFLMLHGLGEDPNPIGRGLDLLLDVVCAELPAPKSDAVPPLPPLMPGQTNRERVASLSAGCGSPCHDVYIDPLGFAFEGFDGMGRERVVDNGLPIDASGSFPFSDGVAEFSDARELMQLLADGPDAHTCYAKAVAGYALGRNIVERDRPLLEDLARVSHAGSLQDVVLALVDTPAFRLRQEAPQ